MSNECNHDWNVVVHPLQLGVGGLRSPLKPTIRWTRTCRICDAVTEFEIDPENPEALAQSIKVDEARGQIAELVAAAERAANLLDQYVDEHGCGYQDGETISDLDTALKPWRKR